MAESSHAIEPQPGDKGKAQAHRRHPQRFPIRSLVQRTQRNAAGRQARAADHRQHAQRAGGPVTQHQGIGQVAQVFLQQAPARAIERVGIGPAIGQGPGGDQRQPHDQRHHHARQRDRLFRRAQRIEQIAGKAQQHAQDHQGVQPHQAQAQELTHAHPRPPVIIGIADDKARQRKEEIHRQGRVVQHHLVTLPQHGDALDVEQHHHHRRSAAQPVEYGKMRLAGGGRIDVVLAHRVSCSPAVFRPAALAAG